MDINDMSAEEKAGFFAGVLVVGTAALIFGPLITIWAVNTLFGASIAYSFVNWFATLWLTGILAAKVPLNNLFQTKL